MKKVLLLTMFCILQFTLMAAFEDEPIDIKSGYCQNGRLLSYNKYDGINTTKMKYELCRINGLRYKNIQVWSSVLSDGPFRNYRPSAKYQELNSCMRIDYDRRIILIDYWLGAFPDGCNGIERERRR